MKSERKFILPIFSTSTSSCKTNQPRCVNIMHFGRKVGQKLKIMEAENKKLCFELLLPGILKK